MGVQELPKYCPVRIIIIIIIIIIIHRNGYICCMCMREATDLASWVYPLLLGWLPSLGHSMGFASSINRPRNAGFTLPSRLPMVGRTETTLSIENCLCRKLVIGK